MLLFMFHHLLTSLTTKSSLLSYHLFRHPPSQLLTPLPLLLSSTCSLNPPASKIFSSHCPYRPTIHPLLVLFPHHPTIVSTPLTHFLSFCYSSSSLSYYYDRLCISLLSHLNGLTIPPSSFLSSLSVISLLRPFYRYCSSTTPSQRFRVGLFGDPSFTSLPLRPPILQRGAASLSPPNNQPYSLFSLCSTFSHYLFLLETSPWCCILRMNL
jgi:hypothetical protein